MTLMKVLFSLVSKITVPNRNHLARSESTDCVIVILRASDAMTHATLGQRTLRRPKAQVKSSPLVIQKMKMSIWRIYNILGK